MKDFAKSIVCNTKAEAEKVGNFEDPKKAKYYIEMWERRRDDAKRSLQNAEGHLKEAMKHRYGDKEFNQREVQRYQEAVKAAEATIKQYDDLIKSAAKTSFGNTRTGNINYSGIKEFKSESELRRWCMDHNYTYTPTHGGYYRLEDDEPGSNRPNIEAHVRQGQETGNSKVGNADPRIASLKAKIKQNKDDVGALKDVLSLAESMIKDLKARKEKLSDEIEKIDNDLLGWQEIKNEIKWN